MSGFHKCTPRRMVLLSSLSWAVPLLFLAGFTLKGHLTPHSFYIAYSNTSKRCDFTGPVHKQYYLPAQSVLFFYTPTVVCALLYLQVGYYYLKYRVKGVLRLVQRGLFVTLFYCLCWLPFMVVSSYYRGAVSPNVFVMMYLSYYFSVIVQPVTYTMTSQFFVKGFTSWLTSHHSSSRSPQDQPVGVVNEGHDSDSSVKSDGEMTSRGV